ncbi:MAG: hypothetical protein P1U75_15860 [Antarcticimicrobium sp.]|uniref:hypothetical protein n=1 Tax=Antarcticimicrobium sp. TaxID=2824147 RepID=UPI002616CE5F|nr:hypothetical protein [Antarcticimicrobium sp.]MDF1718130.1 hypothetical protein [Antarcticimicrobium sp.]
MSVSIKDFVKTALVDIGNAVLEAQSETKIYIAGGHEATPGHYSPQLVQFELTIEVNEQTSGDVQGGVEVPILTIVKASVSADGSKQSASGHTQKVSFAVPVFFNDFDELRRRQGIDRGTVD